MSQLPWTDAQWARVQAAVTEEFTKASVAGAALPCYGPLEGSVEAISKQELNAKASVATSSLTVSVSDFETTRFWNATVYVELNSQQVKDDGLGSAIFAFRRAANYLARVEDHIVFNGRADPAVPSPKYVVAPIGGPSAPTLPPALAAIKLTSGHSSRGLLSTYTPWPGPTFSFTTGLGVAKSLWGNPSSVELVRSDASGYFGQDLVARITAAISNLESNGYAGPFGCVMSPRVFNEAHRPEPGSLVLPADRITPMLGGPLLRSGSMEDKYAVVVANAAESVDIVVATAPKAHFLQVTDDAKFLFRVYERFALRIKDSDAVRPLLLVE